MENSLKQLLGNPTSCSTLNASSIISILGVTVDWLSLGECSWEGDGCALFKSSASMMSEAVKGQTLIYAYDLAHEFINMCTGKDYDENKLGKLVCFSGVREYPNRIKCATLPWHTLLEAIKTGRHG